MIVNHLHDEVFRCEMQARMATHSPPMIMNSQRIGLEDGARNTRS